MVRATPLRQRQAAASTDPGRADAAAARFPEPAEVLVADAGVDGLDALLAGLRPGVALRLVGAGDDGLGEMAAALASPGLDTLHVLGHGEPGAVALGGARLDPDSLGALAGAVRPRAGSILDICLWSCRTGAGKEGAEFMSKLADATGATVFASSGLVGHEGKGGSWNLDRQASPRRGNPFS
ncbi:MAG: hypothetical protein RLZZ276_2487, partial [Pseudomonadota bacterium]